jgi:DNA (cytosine-5)-methyltransferase 1
MHAMPVNPNSPPTCVGLFAGIGGLELGLHRAGFEAKLLCEIDPDASSVLAEHFPSAELHADINGLTALPETDVVCAGFPCQDLSMAGTKTGISGGRSGLVVKLFELIEHAHTRPSMLFNFHTICM